MKLDFPYEVGDEVNLYEDYQTETILKGSAKLVSFHGFGRSFILCEQMPETTQIVYNYQEWITDLDDKPHKIRYLDMVGITNSTSDEEYEKPSAKVLEDNFIIINGIECF